MSDDRLADITISNRTKSARIHAEAAVILTRCSATSGIAAASNGMVTLLAIGRSHTATKVECRAGCTMAGVDGTFEHVVRARGV